MVRIPLPGGGYITRSVTPCASETQTLEACKRRRDAIAVPIWGVGRWRQMLAVPARSAARPRKHSASGCNGVYLEKRQGRAPAWVAVWYEPENRDAAVAESQTHGKRKPRRRRVARFSFGTPLARFSTSATAYEAAVERRREEEMRWYSSLGDGVGMT